MLTRARTGSACTAPDLRITTPRKLDNSRLISSVQFLEKILEFIAALRAEKIAVKSDNRASPLWEQCRGLPIRVKRLHAQLVRSPNPRTDARTPCWTSTLNWWGLIVAASKDCAVNRR